MEPNYLLIMGQAGTGKSTYLRNKLQDFPLYAQICATTGIASVNMDCITLNSLFGYFDTQSLRDAYIDGRFTRAMLRIFKSGFDNIAADEGSMWDGDQLDIFADTLEYIQCNAKELGLGDRQVGLIMLADMAQLPVVRGKPPYEAKYWPKFEANLMKLTKNWRADGDPLFIEFLSLYRQGLGQSAVDLLPSNLDGELFADGLDTNFVGTTILGTNKETAAFNHIALREVKGKEFIVKSLRKGKQLSQWGQNSRTKEWGIPLTMNLKINAYVVLKANKYSYDGERSIIYSNGDCGFIRDIRLDDDGEVASILVELLRNGNQVWIDPITRYCDLADRPDTKRYPLPDGYEPEFDGRIKRWHVGECTYFPMKLAYASTVHSSQSLTLNRVQIDMRKAFMGTEHMMYVGLSRCRSLKGLRLIGNRQLLANRCKIDPRVVRFL